jgi:hypothetical protein
MDRLYGIRPDYCLALRLIGCQEFSRRNQEFVEKHFKGIFMEREMEAEIERLEARIAELKAALKPFADVDVSDCADGHVCYFWGFGENAGKVSAAEVRAARAAYLGEKDD